MIMEFELIVSNKPEKSRIARIAGPVGKFLLQGLVGVNRELIPPADKTELVADDQAWFLEEFGRQINLGAQPPELPAVDNVVEVDFIKRERRKAS